MPKRKIQNKPTIKSKKKTKTSKSVKKPLSVLEKKYLKVCTQAEKNKKLNTSRQSFQCEDLLNDSKPVRAFYNKELKWTIKWYKNANKKNEFDWDEHNKFQKELKQLKKLKKINKKKK